MVRGLRPGREAAGPVDATDAGGSRYRWRHDGSDESASFPPPADEHPLRGIVLDVLQDEGFRPDIDADGDVSFKVEGQTFVHTTEGELPVMRVFGQWQIADNLPDDILAQYRAANDLSLRLNIVKAGINAGTLVVTWSTSSCRVPTCVSSSSSATSSS